MGIEKLIEMINSNSFSLRKAVAVLKEIGHNSRDIAELEPYADKPFAPRQIEQKALAICQTYYQKFAKESPKIVTVTSKNTEGGIVDVKKEDPTVIIQLREEQKQLRDERRAIHMTLEETEDITIRAQKVQRIRQLTPKIDRIFEQLDAYDQTGDLPVKAVVTDKQAVMEVVELYQKKIYLPQRISRLNAWLKDVTLGVHKKERYQKELVLKEEELKTVLQKLTAVEG
jgi:hypothetical protein